MEALDLRESEALDRLISRRASEDLTPDPDEREELWQASVRAHNARRRAENGRAWHDYHIEQAARLRANLEALASHHEQEAGKYLPKGAT